MSTAHPLLQPYQPSRADPFDAVKAAHLLNRCGFGGTQTEIEHVRSIGHLAAVDELLDFPDASAEEQSQTDLPDLSSVPGIPTSFRALARRLRGASEAEKKELRQKINQANHDILTAAMHWWLNRMAYGPHPFQEKLTLFWHGHFTTSAREEHMSMLIWKQNELLRWFAAGNFAELTHAISRDPAMLDYLNNTQNHKAHANENYGRELMELFTLGIGNYTEMDVRQAARAFTGWTHNGENFTFRPADHDYGIKTFLGYTGNFNGDDVVDIILHQPACAPFIAGELYRFFVSDQLEPQLHQALGRLLRENDYQLRPLFRTLLTSKVFYDPKTIGVQIKSPVQLLVGTVRMLGLPMPQERESVGILTQLGQVPFMPPNVRGWVGHRQWINTNTVFVRYNMGVRLANERLAPLPDDQAGTPQAAADQWIAKLVQRPIADHQKNVLVNALGDDPGNRWSLRRMVQLILSMPEYQLC
jgi:uncharacterized protein (DUF1800 family)